MMIKRVLLCLVLLIAVTGTAQVDSLYYKTQKIAVKDSITFYHLSTNPDFFTLSTTKGLLVDKKDYKVDFKKSILVLIPDFFTTYKNIDSLVVRFYPYPDFLTRTYSGLDPKLIVTNTRIPHPISQESRVDKLTKKPLEGLDTQGSIIRGISVGTNQDAVLNSVLDLTIEGKLSPRINLRARINDTNIPIQENGYSQDLKDLDRVYMEMEGPKWMIKAGDIFLQNKQTYFMDFTKKVSGVSVATRFDSLHFSASGALVKGRFTSYQFQGQEANQGPYKLKGQSGESYIFIINASEKVYINGVLQKRGEQADYLVDYTTGEIRFMPTKPITSDMRIRVEFQYSDRNYTRFVTHDGVTYRGKKLQVGAFFYRESDVKNQPLQQNLTEEQIAMLANLENTDTQLMFTNAVETDYAENLILYRKIIVGAATIFEYSTDVNETLYQVDFTFVGPQQGDYKVLEYLANGKKMEYVGMGLGDYVAASPLIAPSKQQLAVINAKYQPSLKTDFSMELAYSDQDANLFSPLDNNANQAPAIKMRWQQSLLDTTATGWQLQGHVQFDFLHRNFKSIERIYAVEFNRDWNLTQPAGNQRWLQTGLHVYKKGKGYIDYSFENLNFTGSYNGNRHRIATDYTFNNSQFTHNTSYLTSEGNLTNSRFLQSKTSLMYHKKKWWFRTLLDVENNKQQSQTTQELSQKSYRFTDVQALFGIGDSTKVFMALGMGAHQNDSLKNGTIQPTDNANTWFIDTQLLKNKNSQLKCYANYRLVRYQDQPDLDAFNTNIFYKQNVFDQFIQLVTNYQNKAGNIPEQEYQYIETDQGQGYYTWIDYNENGIQELDEFEIAQFADQANFLRVALPNVTYIPTQEASLQQSIMLNFSKWNTQKGLKKIVSHWSNQLQILAKNNQRKSAEALHLNPFSAVDEALAVQYNLRNSLFFNRGKAHYSTTYQFTNLRQKTVHLFNTQELFSRTHRLLFRHKIQENWQLGFILSQTRNSSSSDTFTSRDFDILSRDFSPEVTYLFSKKHWLKSSYSTTRKENFKGDLEVLNKRQISVDYLYTNKKDTRFSVGVKWLENDFTGMGFSVVGYQMLEGLQPGKNILWNVLWSKKINSFMFLNLNYSARANTISRTVHNGTVQLRAQF